MIKHPVKIVSKITSNQDKAHKRKSYHYAHRKGNEAEKERFGKKQFDYINDRIKKLPKGHWAGTHTQNHHIHISKEFLNLIPKSKQKSVIAEIKLHEITEDIIMCKNKRHKK